MANEFKIRVDLTGVVGQLQEAVAAKVFPRLTQAVAAIAEQGAADWKEQVYRAKLWSGEKQAYIDSIQWQMTGSFSALIWSDYKNAEPIENGRPAYDLKQMLRTSLKVRITKKGERYLIIPFRHNTPGAGAVGAPMPPSVYAAAKQLGPSLITGQTQRKSGTGAFGLKSRKRLTVNQNMYSWGGSLPAGLAPKMKPQHKTDIYAGMYRFDTSSGKSKSSSYVTFRVMKEGSPGWIIPPRSGLHIAQTVTERLSPLAQTAFMRAVQLDAS